MLHLMAAPSHPLAAPPSRSSILCVTLAERPDLGEPIAQLSSAPWPEFLRHDAAVNRWWSRLSATFPAFQMALCDETGAVVAAARAVPLVWTGAVEDLPLTIGAVLERGFADHAGGRTPTALAALAAVVASSHQCRGLSYDLIRAMSQAAAAHGLGAVIAPVRPIWKARYPLTPMERYVGWTREDGSPFDPWIRVHWRLGAERLAVMPEAMLIAGTVGEWEAWTQMRFPESGTYVVPGALQPVQIDRERDSGRYADPNVWMRHPIDPSR
jgi:hypothetical protein